MPAERISLETRYTATEGPIFLSGIQALVRLLLLQSRRDAASGLRTRGFVSGYRGSPLGGLDLQLARARAHLDGAGVHFAPGVNEDLAATAVWGSQQVGSFPRARAEGVYGLWYGKAPGVDRSGDAFKHANASGTSARGGVLAVAGDDHGCKSSTLPSQSELAFMDAAIPVLHPADVQEVLEYGLHGWALSRFSGLWVGLIALADTMDSAATVSAELPRMPFLPEIEKPTGGFHFRPGRAPLELEELIHRYRLPAVRAYARANGLNRVWNHAPGAELGIVTVGGAHLEVLDALDQLGLRDRLAELGVRIYKVGMPWPLEPEGLREFARGLRSILVVEEKRGVVEPQIKEHLYGLGAHAPRVLGKHDELGQRLIPETGEVRALQLAPILARRLPPVPEIARRVDELAAREASLARIEARPVRAPLYCPGCPHGRSTVLPEGSRGMAGIGCHYMVTWMNRETTTFSHMGGEGVQWIGQAPFTDEPHVFANLGDGTYHHSGILAIRAAVAARVPITYKILYNDAVAMTGGQSVDGPLSVPLLVKQLAAEGVSDIRVVADDVTRHRTLSVPVHDRDELDRVQRELREKPGCTVIIYDQTCAAELRRRRKRGLAIDPGQRLFINEEVCEGCGDCSEQSSCAAVEPVETDLGLKRRINQTACNKDYSCANGLCPSFVRVTGGKLRRHTELLPSGDLDLPLPTVSLTEDETWSAVIAGVGGTGVVTVGALLGTAAHIEGLAATTLDMTGLAQKGGAVTSQIRVARDRARLHSPRLGSGGADLLLACDLVVAVGTPILRTLDRTRTYGVLNHHLTPTADFVLANRPEPDADALAQHVSERLSECDSLDATRLAERTLGDSVSANLILLGYAFQKGRVPLRLESIRTAIELNAVSITENLQAFALGRLAAVRPAALEALQEPKHVVRDESLLARVARLGERLCAYQNEAYAERYRQLVAEVSRAERHAAPGSEKLTATVAETYFQLLAYKDEYEVARLYTSPDFRKRLDAQIEGDYSLELLLAPPLWARRDPDTGRPHKHAYGSWMLGAMRVLAKLKFLRGTPLDPFGYTADRRLERSLIRGYEDTMRRLLTGLGKDNLHLAVRIAELPREIRGFDLVKRERAEKVLAQSEDLLERFELKHAPQDEPEDDATVDHDPRVKLNTERDVAI